MPRAKQKTYISGPKLLAAWPRGADRDLVLQSVGRTPNGKKITADKAGVAVADRGFIHVDIQTRTNVPHIFAIGDIVGQPMLAHKAVHEAHVAVEVIAGELQGNKELAAAALNARAIANGRYEGVSKLLFDDPPQAHGHCKVLGGGMLGARAGDMIGETVRAIELRPAD